MHYYVDKDLLQTGNDVESDIRDLCKKWMAALQSVNMTSQQCALCHHVA